MSYNAKILADSISPDGVRLTTIQATFPRFILAEINTHRMLSRNSASSRAIPVEKRIAAIEADPFIPEQFGKNQKGMQANEVLGDNENEIARSIWHSSCDAMIHQARLLAGLGVHKQLANRLLEPFAWHTVIFTATEWSNLFHLRCHPSAQPEFQRVAVLMRDSMLASKPKLVPYGAWHLPLIVEADIEAMKVEVGSSLFAAPEVALPQLDRMMEKWCKVSIARCARVSTLTHEGKRDIEEDLKLYERLVSAGHMSPLEHVARPMTKDERWDFMQRERTWNGQRWVLGGATHFCGNLNGWVSWRKLVPGEADILDPARVTP